jgi:hypothetical protein
MLSVAAAGGRVSHVCTFNVSCANLACPMLGLLWAAAYHLQTRQNTAGGSIGEEHIAMACGLAERTIGVANTWLEAQQMQVCRRSLGGSSRYFGVVNVSKL